MTQGKEIENRGTVWVVQRRIPGYFGKNKDEIYAGWNREFGERKWRIGWELRGGSVLDFDGIFWQVYVPGYQDYFMRHEDEANYLTSNFSYAYDKDLVKHDQAFDPNFLYNKPGVANQFHHVALNVALVEWVGKPFRGSFPIQVREGKPGTDRATWPAGWKWSPGRIPARQAERIPKVEVEKPWWEAGSIEDLYQRAKVLEVRK